MDCEAARESRVDADGQDACRISVKLQSTSIKSENTSPAHGQVTCIRFRSNSEFIFVLPNQSCA